MIIAKDFGFLPQNSAEENSKALQKAVDCGGDIYIDTPGIYNVCDAVEIGDDTSIYFCAGSYLKRNHAVGETSYVFINKGAYSRTYNKNIKIEGLKIICNDVVCGRMDENAKKVIMGLCGHISFFYVKNLVLRDIEMLDLPEKDFGIQVCTFKNILIENVRIEGMKDAVHLGRGKDFVIRGGRFRTYDDPIALNAHDYRISNPQLGWIENGIIEDCYDYDADSTVGYFARILAGAWVDWYSGMMVQNSDTVAYGGRLYRVMAALDCKEYTSVTPPTHTEGIKEYDGIKWIMIQDDVEYEAGCRNIVFRNIFLLKKRPIAFSIHFDKDCYSRSYYPNANSPVQENIVFENIFVRNEIGKFLSAITPVNSVKVVNSTIGGSIEFRDIETEGIEYKPVKVLLSGNTFIDDKERVICQGGRTVEVSESNNM